MSKGREPIISLQRLKADAERRYQREQTLMLGHICTLGRQLQRSAGTAQAPMHNGPVSWLGQQRKGVGKVPLDHFRIKLTAHPIPHPAQPNCSTMIAFSSQLLMRCLPLFHSVNGFTISVCKTLPVHRMDMMERTEKPGAPWS